MEAVTAKTTLNFLKEDSQGNRDLGSFYLEGILDFPEGHRIKVDTSTWYDDDDANLSGEWEIIGGPDDRCTPASHYGFNRVYSLRQVGVKYDLDGE